jgi:TrbL/VirB6 plasmid conjugal transfer protein
MCGKFDLGCSVHEGFKSFVNGQFDALLQKIGETATAGLQAVATFWIRADGPKLVTDGQGWTESGPVGYLREHVMVVTVPIFTIAVIVAGVRMAWEQRAEPLQQLLRAILTFVVVAGLGTATLHVLVAASDEFSISVVEQATTHRNQEFSAALGGLVLQGGVTALAAQGLPMLVAMFVGVAVFMASLVQVVLLLIRSAMLVVLAGTFPLAAAATNTEVGRTWFKKYCGWALAFIAYKPAAALVYAAAIRMNESADGTTSSNHLVQAMSGLMMILLAVFALPALLRFAVPVTAAVAGGHAGTGGGIADPGGLATGAINVGKGLIGGGGGGSGSGGGGATGALGVGAKAGLGAAGAAITGAKKAGNALAGAASHSAGEAGGGSTGSSGASSSPAWGIRRTPAAPPPERVREPAGPSGSN